MVELAIESAISQTFKNIEIIVMDNASTDEIESVVSKYHDQRLRLVRNSENIGQFGNFNRCIELCRGTYLYILHSDDYIEPDFIELSLIFFDSHPDVSLTFTSAIFESQSGRVNHFFHDSDLVIPAPEGFRRLLHQDNYIICPSVIAKRSIYDEIGKFSLQYQYSGDFYQWLKVTRRFDIGYVRDAIIHCREGEHSETYSLIQKSPAGYLEMIKIMIQISAELGEDYPIFRTDFNVYYKNFISICHNSSQVMINYAIGGFNPVIFTGLAMMAWGMIKPESKREILYKGLLLCSIVLYFIFTLIGIIKKRKRFEGMNQW